MQKVETSKKMDTEWTQNDYEDEDEEKDHMSVPRGPHLLRIHSVSWSPFYSYFLSF